MVSASKYGKFRQRKIFIWGEWKLKKPLLAAIVLLASLSFFLFLTGFILGANDVLNPKPSVIQKLKVETNNELHKKDGKLQVLGLGDSLTRGVGDSEGLGYAGRFVNLLKKTGDVDISLANLAISGAKAPNLLKQLENTGVQYSLTQADVIMITIGGNDLNPGWDKLGEIDLTKYQADINSFSKNVRAILDQIRTVNADAQIYWMGLYNPFEDIEELKGSSENIVYWNTAIEGIALEYKNVFVIPVYDLFQTQTKKLLSSDHFHPNDVGYQLMAERLLQKVQLQLGISPKEGESK